MSENEVKPAKPIRRSRKRIANRSARREAQVDERARVIFVVYQRDGGRCQAEAKVPGIRCDGPLDAHEIIPRSAWRDGYLEPSNVVLVCRQHHQWIDNHPELAHAAGLHGFSYERPDA